MLGLTARDLRLGTLDFGSDLSGLCQKIVGIGIHFGGRRGNGQAERGVGRAIHQQTELRLEGRFLLVQLQQPLFEQGDFGLGFQDILLANLAGPVSGFRNSLHPLEHLFLGPGDGEGMLDGIEIEIGFFGGHDDFEFHCHVVVMHELGVFLGDLAAQSEFAEPRK